MTGARKSKKTEVRNRMHHLADDLVTRGHVPEEKRDALATYLTARERFLGRFGVSSSGVQRSLERVLRSADALAGATRDARQATSSFHSAIEEEVLPDLRVILGEEDAALMEIEQAAKGLRFAPVTLFDPEPVQKMARQQEEAHDRLQKLLGRVRERLDATSQPGRHRAG